MVEVRTAHPPPNTVFTIRSLFIALEYKKKTFDEPGLASGKQDAEREKKQLVTYLDPSNSARLTTGTGFIVLPLRQHFCCGSAGTR